MSEKRLFLVSDVAERKKAPLVSVVIPARNEAQNLQYVLPYIPSIVSEIVLVNGHSIDNTVEVAQQLYPSICIIEQIGNGKGDALRIGFEACTGDIIVMLDADGSADPREIPFFVEALMQGNDFAKGTRFMQGGGSHDITWLRFLGNYGLSRLVNALFLTRFSDLCYGYNAFWKHCLEHVKVDTNGFEVEALINIRMHQARLKIVEIPSMEYPRIYGTSNLNTFKDGLRVLKTIFRERGRKATVPLHLSHHKEEFNIQDSAPISIGLMRSPYSSRLRRSQKKRGERCAGAARTPLTPFPRMARLRARWSKKEENA